MSPDPRPVARLAPGGLVQITLAENPGCLARVAARLQRVMAWAVVAAVAFGAGWLCGWGWR